MDAIMVVWPSHTGEHRLAERTSRMQEEYIKSATSCPLLAAHCAALQLLALAQSYVHTRGCSSCMPIPCRGV